MSGFFSSFIHSNKDEHVLKYKKRVVLAKSHFKNLAKLVEKYAKTTEKLSQRGINISDAVFSGFEDLAQEGGVTLNVENFCRNLTALQEERKQLACDLKSRIAGDFRVNETKCKETKKEIDVCIQLIDKENREKGLLNKLQNKVPINRTKVMETKVRLEKAQVLTKSSRNLLDKQMEEFEMENLQDSGRILREFVRREMQFHAKCLQIYTNAYRQLMKIPETINDNTVFKLIEEETGRESLAMKSTGRESPAMKSTGRESPAIKSKDLFFIKKKHDTHLSLTDIDF